MQSSLITGFPILATSKSTLRRTLKLLILLICAAGFFYQTNDFLGLYFSYPVMLDIEVSHPEIVTVPAVTICNRNRLRRQAYCTAFPEHCEGKFENREEFCEKYPKYCRQRPNKNEVLQVVDGRRLVTQNRSNEFLNTFGPQKKSDLINSCGLTEIQTRINCKNIIAVQVSKRRYPTKCFIVESLLGKPAESPWNLSRTSDFRISLKLRPEEYMNYYDMVQAYVYVHNPRSTANPIAEGVALEAGFQYKLYVSMEKSESLPAPYRTNCTDYMSKWLENGGYGPLTKKDCTETCNIKSMVEKYGCVGQTVTYPNNFTICDNIAISPSEEIRAKCMENCNDPCDGSVYTMTAELEDNLGDLMCSKVDEHCKHDSIIIDISFSRMSITKYKHEPKFQDIELFSYIGGYMGMWLGISLVSLFDFVEMMFDIIAYPVKKWKKKLKRVRQGRTLSANTIIIR